MVDCVEIEADQNILRPPAFPVMKAGDTEWLYHNWAAVDCQGAGVTLTDATYTVDPADAANGVSVPQSSVSGLLASFRVDVLGAASDAATRIHATFRFSDGRVLNRSFTIVVAAYTTASA